MKERILLILCSLLFTHSILANFAKVILVRGSVTQLAPGELLARKVKKGEMLKMESSLLTGEKSFLRLSLEDGSTLSLGPESKIVLKNIGQTKSDRSVINLLKGSLRSKIQKSDDGKMHFFIKTKTAAMGVRGTEFEAVYGPESGVTSLLTYKGAVSMAHTTEVEKASLKVSKDLEYSRESDLDKSLVIEEDRDEKKITDPIEKMEIALNKDNASTVKAGQLSQTVDTLDSVALPIVINPVQFNLLYENTDFSETSNSKDRKSANLEQQNVKLRAVATDTPVEGVYDKANKIYAPKSGGFFDRKTGLYIPPSADALFDQTNRVFVDKELGNIDSKTGEYIPPLGLEIDPKKGFVKKQFKDNTPSALLAKVELNQKKLNSALDHSIVVGDGPHSEKETKYYLSYRELIAKNVFTLSLSGFDQSFDIKDSTRGSNGRYDNDSGIKTTLGLAFDSGSRLKPFFNFSLTHNDFQTGESNISQSGDKLTAIGVGLKYSLAPQWNIITQLTMDQEFFVLYSSSESTITSSFDRFTIPKLTLGLQGEWFRYKKLSGEAQALLGTNITKSSGDTEVSMGLSYSLSAGLRYWPSKKWYMTTHIFREGESYSVSGTSYVYEYDASRTSTGLNFGFGTYF